MSGEAPSHDARRLTTDEMTCFRAATIALTLIATSAAPAMAHPHVWVTAKAEIGYDAQGRVAEVAHRWTFDEFYSGWVTQGLPREPDGSIGPEHLADIAELNATSLVDFDYFTFLNLDGSEVPFATPTDYEMAFDGKQATLSFRLPLAEPVAARSHLVVEIWDPEFFVSFRIEDGEEAVQLAGAPGACAVDVSRSTSFDISLAAEQNILQMERLSESLFDTLTQLQGTESDFVNRVLVACP